MSFGLISILLRLSLNLLNRKILRNTSIVSSSHQYDEDNGDEEDEDEDEVEDGVDDEDDGIDVLVPTVALDAMILLLVVVLSSSPVVFNCDNIAPDANDDNDDDDDADADDGIETSFSFNPQFTSTDTFTQWMT